MPFTILLDPLRAGGFIPPVLARRIDKDRRDKLGGSLRSKIVDGARPPPLSATGRKLWS
jgi:hypothetical protein